MKTIIFDLDGTLLDLSSLQDKVPRIFILPEILRELSQKYQLALVTGATLGETKKALRIAKMYQFFKPELTITKESTVRSKKSGDPFKLLKKRISEFAIVIGDSNVDSFGAKQADLLCLRVQKMDDVKKQQSHLISIIRQAQTILESENGSENR